MSKTEIITEKIYKKSVNMQYFNTDYNAIEKMILYRKI